MIIATTKSLYELSENQFKFIKIKLLLVDKRYYKRIFFNFQIAYQYKLDSKINIWVFTSKILFSKECDRMLYFATIC